MHNTGIECTPPGVVPWVEYNTLYVRTYEVNLLQPSSDICFVQKDEYDLINVTGCVEERDKEV